MDRIIRFKSSALLSPGTYVAMVNDGVKVWSVTGPANQEVYIHDSEHDDFPSLRAELTKQRASYDFYQRRKGDGDDGLWYHGRSGNPEVISHFGVSEMQYDDLCDCNF